MITKSLYGQSADALSLGAATGPMSNRAFGAAGTAGIPKVLLVVLCQDELFKTDGTTSYLPTVYELPEVRTLGPMINRMRVHYVAENATSSNFRGRVTLMWSVLGRTWSTPDAVLAAQAGTQTGVISSWYTTDANFGLFIRPLVEVSNVSGTAIESARLTAVLEIELKS